MVDHHIQYIKQLYLGDKLLIKTFPEAPEGIRQPRKVEFYSNGELIADSRTKWIMINPDSQKIIRIEKNWLSELE